MLYVYKYQALLQLLLLLILLASIGIDIHFATTLYEYVPITITIAGICIPLYTVLVSMNNREKISPIYFIIYGTTMCYLVIAAITFLIILGPIILTAIYLHLGLIWNMQLLMLLIMENYGKKREEIAG